MRILVVEDEEIMADAVTTALRRHGHAVDVVHDGGTALEYLDVNDYDVLVLDRDLPVVHGDEVCARVVERGRSRVLLLTASSALHDRVEGLDLGADDYLTKPFAGAELRARVEALGRRAIPARRPVLEVGDIVVDGPACRATLAGADLGLSLKEFRVLEVLAASAGSVVSSEELLERVWDERTDPFTTVVRVTVLGLRRKLGEPRIQTVRGAGYRLTT